MATATRARRSAAAEQPARSPRRWVESTLALAVSLAVAVLAARHLLRPEVVEGDALVHLYWFLSVEDPALFTDSLTAALRESERYPDGYEALLTLASRVADPVAFAEWLGVALMAGSGWLVFLIVRRLAPWPPAAWLAGALFLALDGHRFYGGFPRAFVHPIVLLVVLLALRGRHTPAALVAAGGALLYPPAALLAVGVLVVSSVRIRARRLGLDRRRALFALLAFGLVLAAVGLPRLAAGAVPDVLSAAEARAFPDFGERGPLHFFVPSTLDYLRQNRSGFDLRATGSMLALAALALLALRRANVRLVPSEVLALPLVALTGFAAAQAVLFRLYLPHRYTYPLLAFFAIVVGVCLLPTWTALLAQSRPRLRALALLVAPLPIAYLAVYAFPLGPRLPLERLALPATAVRVGAVVLVAAATVLVLRQLPRRVAAQLGAVVCGLVLLAALLAAPGRRPPGQECAQTSATRYLATLPKDAVIAGDPVDLRCLPLITRRAVVISTQLAPSYERGYFLAGRARMLASLRAYYGPSAAAIGELGRRYDATHLWVRRDAIDAERTAGRGERWRRWQRPYGRYVRDLLSTGTPASLHLPAPCRRWRRGGEAVYEIDCLARSVR